MEPVNYTIDAAGKSVGRVATEVAVILQGKNSPFFANKKTDLVHPSTKVIFGEPDKKPRPFTSKVSSVLRKSLMLSRKGKVLNETNEPPVPKNALSAFAGTSMSSEKQKIVNYYGSSGSIKEIKNKVKKCEYLF